MLKDESIHFCLSVLAGAIVFLLTGDCTTFLLATLTGFFIDADHLFDYLLFKRGRGLNLQEFFSGSFFNKSEKVILPLHGFEFGLILIGLGFFLTNQNYLFWSLGLSLILHLIYDTISNKPIWPTYFILYRLFKNFDHRAFRFKCS